MSRRRLSGRLRAGRALPGCCAFGHAPRPVADIGPEEVPEHREERHVREHGLHVRVRDCARPWFHGDDGLHQRRPLEGCAEPVGAGLRVHDDHRGTDAIEQRGERGDGDPGAVRVACFGVRNELPEVVVTRLHRERRSGIRRECGRRHLSRSAPGWSATGRNRIAPGRHDRRRRRGTPRRPKHSAHPILPRSASTSGARPALALEGGIGAAARSWAAAEPVRPTAMSRATRGIAAGSGMEPRRGPWLFHQRERREVDSRTQAGPALPQPSERIMLGDISLS